MSDKKTFESHYIETHFTLSLNEVCESFCIEREWLFEIIEEGIVHPASQDKKQPYFDENDIKRIRTSLRLHQDLGVNISGIAVVLDLLDKIEQIRANEKP